MMTKPARVIDGTVLSVQINHHTGIARVTMADHDTDKPIAALFDRKDLEALRRALREIEAGPAPKYPEGVTFITDRTW